MSNKLYVGQLPFSVDNDELKEIFEAYGQVKSAQVITDRDTGRSKGFGFVEMSSAEDAKSAIKALDGSDVQGRSLKVNIAKPREDRPARGNRRF